MLITPHLWALAAHERCRVSWGRMKGWVVAVGLLVEMVVHLKGGSGCMQGFA